MQRIKAKFPRGFIPVLQRNFLLKNWRILKVPHQFRTKIFGNFGVAAIPESDVGGGAAMQRGGRPVVPP